MELNDSHEACDVTKEKKVSLIIKFNKRTIFLTKCGIYKIYNFFWTHYLTGIIDLGIIIALNISSRLFSSRIAFSRWSYFSRKALEQKLEFPFLNESLKKKEDSLSLSSVLLLRDTISNLILRENGWPTGRGQARTSNKFPRINGDQTPTRGSVILVTM